MRNCYLCCFLLSLAGWITAGFVTMAKIATIFPPHPYISSWLSLLECCNTSKFTRTFRSLCRQFSSFGVLNFWPGDILITFPGSGDPGTSEAIGTTVRRPFGYVGPVQQKVCSLGRQYINIEALLGRKNSNP